MHIQNLDDHNFFSFTSHESIHILKFKSFMGEFNLSSCSRTFPIVVQVAFLTQKPHIYNS